MGVQVPLSAPHFKKRGYSIASRTSFGSRLCSESEVIEATDSARTSVATLVETSIVIESRYGAEGLCDLDRFLPRVSIELIPLDLAQGQLARSAFSRFGKGRHRAALNYGDCFSYAAAITLGEPLLCKGDAFIHTDVIFRIRDG